VTAISDFSPNLSQRPLEKSDLGYANDARTDVVRDAITASMSFVASEPGMTEMVYQVNGNQLLRLWSVISCFEVMREIQDPAVQSTVITKAQTLLTAFVLDLTPLPEENDKSATVRAGLEESTGFDA